MASCIDCSHRVYFRSARSSRKQRSVTPPALVSRLFFGNTKLTDNEAPAVVFIVITRGQESLQNLSYYCVVHSLNWP
jgi:hypothetical protein